MSPYFSSDEDIELQKKKMLSDLIAFKQL